MSTPIILTTLNARFMHSAFGLRYLLANLGELQHQADILEFTIQEQAQQIAEQLLNRQPVKASLFVAGVWTLGAVWLLLAPWTRGLLESQGVSLGVPAPFDSPLVLGGVTLAWWLLSVLEAVIASRR